MWAWLTGKLAGIGAFIGVAAIIVLSLLRQGRQKEELKQEKAKSKEQDIKHNKQIEIIKAVKDVETKNTNAPDSTIINRLRSKWQRD